MENEALFFLKQQIAERVKSFNRSRIYYKNFAFNLHIAITILTAISTIVLGLDDFYFNKDITRIVALILAAIVTFLSSFNTFYDYKSMWVSYNNAINDFYKLQFEITFTEKERKEINNQLIEKYKMEYQNILDRINNKWTDKRNK